MKLISCNVENFGTLKNYKIDFNGGLTVLHEENGFGKSTLAVFIKAMFYGLPVLTKRKLDENERKKYTPWQKGVFGGSLDFEKDGKRYRIERFLGEKEKDDTVKVYDLDYGREYDGFGENIGLSLFGIDAESFERSVYMPQITSELKINSSLSAKLTGLVENSDDISNFDTALKVLNDRAKQYVPIKGSGGTVAEKEREIEKLGLAVTDSKASADNLDRLNLEIESLKNSQSQLNLLQKQIREKITVASDIAAREAEAKQYNELKDSLAKTEADLTAICSKYPNGLPNASQINEIEEDIKALSRAEAELSVLKNDASDRNELAELLNEFEVLPEESEITEIKSKHRRLCELKIKTESLDVRVETPASNRASNSKLPKILIAVAAMSVLSGVGVLLWQTAVGIALLGVGILILGVSAFLYLKNMITANSGGQNNSLLVAEYKKLTAEIDALTDSVNGFGLRYQLEGDFDEALERLTNAKRDTERLKTAVSRQDNDIKACMDRIAEVRSALDKAFSGFNGLDGEYSVMLDAVKTDKRTALTLKAEAVRLNEKLSQLPEIKEIRETEKSLNREELLAKEKQLGGQLDSIIENINLKENEARRLLPIAEALSEYEEQLENAKQELAELKSRYKVISTTAKLLEKAKNDLSLRYVDRMKQDFVKYCEILGAEFDGTMLDSDLNLKLKDGGASRNRESYSQGFRDMMDIAMRLSLSDAMFEGEEVMLILDDPFVNLDDARLKNAMSLLKKLSDNRQIIYLTCHSSRC